MKILMVNKFLYPRGGAESYMFRVAEEMVRRGHEVQYFGMYDKQNTVTNNLGLYTTNMDFHGSSLSRLTYPFKIIYSREAKSKIGKVLDDFKPDIVHMNNINFQLTPSIIDAVKKRGIPLVQTVHDYQMACPNHLFYDFGCKHTCTKCVGRGKMACIKGRCIHSSLVKSIIGVIESKLYRMRGTYKKVDKYICPSQFLADKLMAENQKTYDGRCVAIHNFVEKEGSDKKYTSNYDFPYIAFAGRLSEEKGTRVLAAAAKLLPDVHFVVMGNGPEEGAFEGLDNVTMTGFVTGDTLKANIACAEAIAVPSVCFENCPLSILEAQILGVPSVTMNMGGMAELVEDGYTGTLSSDVTPEAFAEAIKKTLADQDKLSEMKSNCLIEAEKAITLAEYGAKVEEIYHSIGC